MSGTPVTGVILAGGESRRMGTHKALVLWKNRPLIQWVYDALYPLCKEILIIANTGDFSFLNARVYPDNFPGTGPAAGIETALSRCSTPLALISSCDTPNLSTSLFSHLLDHHGTFEISIAGHDGTDEPLIGVYSRSATGHFHTALMSGNARPPRIIRQTRWQAIPITPELDFYRTDLFLNLNAPEDLNTH